MSPNTPFFTHPRKGLSEVVAAVVLTLVSLIALAVAYGVGMLKVAPSVSSTGLLVSAHLEPFGDGALLEVTVYNVGKEPLTFGSIRLLRGSTSIFAAAPPEFTLKPSTSWSNTYVVTGVTSGETYVVEARAETQRSDQKVIIGSVEVSMR